MKPRREREREEMRNLITDAARTLFVSEGYDQVTVRRIADAIEYTPGAIYSYFEDKDAILHALHRRGFEDLMRYMADATLELAATGGTPLAQLYKLGEVYLRFARENPEMYDLMFVAKAPMRADGEQWPEGGRAFDVLRGVVRSAVEGGWILPGDPEAIAFALWSTCHGMVTLEFRGRCAVIDEALRPAIAGEAYTYVVQALTAPAHRNAHAPSPRRKAR